MFVYVKFVILFVLSYVHCQVSESTSGGIETISNDDPNLLMTLNSVQDQIRTKYSFEQGTTTVQLGKVHSATLQIVAGNIWQIVIDLQKQICTPDCVNTTERCSLSIHSQPWVNEHQLMNLECK